MDSVSSVCIRAVQSDTHRNLLVYDLGGGTLDVTVLEVEGSVFEIRSTSGDMQLGGQDFDSNLLMHFLPEVGLSIFFLPSQSLWVSFCVN